MEYPTFLSSSPCFFLLLDPARDFTFEDVFAERNEQEGCLFEYHFFEADHIAFKPQVRPSFLSLSHLSLQVLILLVKKKGGRPILTRNQGCAEKDSLSRDGSTKR